LYLLYIYYDLLQHNLPSTFIFVTVLPFARMRKWEPEKLVGLPGFTGRVNKRCVVDLE